VLLFAAFAILSRDLVSTFHKCANLEKPSMHLCHPAVATNERNAILGTCGCQKNCWSDT